ncbi:glycosyltransferase family 2 protein [Anaerostipes hadrus]|uniref:glycosyltransferase family 2 protein n=1 Tax=Anaerostipes hadrus TaxID=649756 RepID=UPI0022DF00F2|nr:glycosyltransferase [Anaerostipes hadrus]
MNDLISIVVPVYNVENYLDRCVKSIIAQVYTNIEIILVDDGSSDNSGKICEKWKEKDKRIIVIHKKNGGLSSARNAGIEIAKGKYIAFVDSDDYISKNMYSELYRVLKQNNSDIAICGRKYVWDNGKRYCRYHYDKRIENYSSKEAIREMNSFRKFDMAAWDKLYRTSLFENIRFPEGKLSEDYYIMYKLFLKSKKVVYYAYPLYYYYQRQNSITKNKKINFDFINAAYDQMIEVSRAVPELKSCVSIAYASANMTVYNFHIKNKVKCTKENKKKMKKAVRCNFKYICKSSDISIIKKIQSLLFITSIPLYRVMFYFAKKVDKV